MKPKDKKIITAFFDAKTAAALDREAEKNMRSRSSELLYIVQQYLDQKQKETIKQTA